MAKLKSSSQLHLLSKAITFNNDTKWIWGNQLKQAHENYCNLNMIFCALLSRQNSASENREIKTISRDLLTSGAGAAWKPIKNHFVLMFLHLNDCENFSETVRFSLNVQRDPFFQFNLCKRARKTNKISKKWKLLELDTVPWEFYRGDIGRQSKLLPTKCSANT